VTASPDCLSCGTCCFSTLETYVPVRGEDHARLGDRADELVVFHGNRAFMKMAGGHCAALRVDLDDLDVRDERDERGNARFVCSVYDARPGTCRELARGSRECEGEIATKGDRPLILLRRGRADARAPAP